MPLKNSYDLNGLTVKQENFALKFVEHGHALRAYRESYPNNMGDTAARTEASRVRNHPSVAQRILQLQEENRNKNSISLEYITNGLKEAIKMAKENEDISNLRQAYMDIAKLHGLIVEKRIVDNNIKINKDRGEIAERFARRFNIDD